MIKKLITPLILPPGIFIIILFWAGFRLMRRKGWKAGVITVTVALALWLCSLGPVANWLMRGLEAGQVIPPAPRGDVIILLGGGVRASAPDLTGEGAPVEDAIARVVSAARLQRRLGLPVIVSGGAFSEGDTPEAPILKRFLVDLGVPEKRVLVEDRSRDTEENARNVKVICGKHGFSAPLLVTSAYHMRRSVRAFEHEGVRVVPVPANFMAGRIDHLTILDLLPKAPALMMSSRALHERLGLVFYRVVHLKEKL